MNQNKLNFASENLVVDWISFNAKGLTDPEPIAKYLLRFGFNSLQFNKQEGLPRMEILFKHQENKFNVIFSRPIEYWNGTVISFSGENATYLYKLIQQKSIHFSFFRPIQLGRLDLPYFHFSPTFLVYFTIFYKKLFGAPYLTSSLIEGYALVFLDQITFQRRKK